MNSSWKALSRGRECSTRKARNATERRLAFRVAQELEGAREVAVPGGADFREEFRREKADTGGVLRFC